MSLHKIKQFFNKSRYLSAFTLIEVYIALVVFSVAGLTLISMNAYYLRQSVVNEFRSQLKGFAEEGLAKVQHLSITDWNSIPVGSKQMYYFTNIGGKTVLQTGCHRSLHDPQLYLAGPGESNFCENLQQAGQNTFLRGILITNYATAFTDAQGNIRTKDGRKIEVWVSCAWKKCDGKLLPPYSTSLVIFER